MVYVPTVVVSTVPETSTVTLLSTLSVAVAPGSIKGVLVAVICIAASPLSVTTGGVMSVEAGVEVEV